MIPVVFGIIASSKRGSLPASDSYTVSPNCGGSSPYTIYVYSGFPIDIGTSTIVYTTAALTTPLTNTSFVYSNYTYTTNGSGLITTKAICYSSYTVYTDCTLLSSATVYTQVGTTPTATSTIYSDTALIIPWANQTLFVYYDGSSTYYRYQTDGNGLVSAASGLATCPYQFTIYGDCNQSGGGTTVWSDDSTPFPGGSIYTDEGLTIQYNGNFVRSNYNYNATAGSVTALYPCYRSWVTYADCNSYRDGGTPTTYYRAWLDSTLQNGVAVYTDSNLTVPVGFVTFAYAGILYTAHTGAITSTAACVYSWPYNISGCGQPDLLNTYFYTTTTSISIGTIIYSNDGLGGRLAALSLYRYGYNTYFNTDINGVVESINSCPT